MPWVLRPLLRRKRMRKHSPSSLFFPLGPERRPSPLRPRQRCEAGATNAFFFFFSPVKRSEFSPSLPGAMTLQRPSRLARHESSPPKATFFFFFSSLPRRGANRAVGLPP